jgi:hypothetical protein
LELPSVLTWLQMLMLNSLRDTNFAAEYDDAADADTASADADAVDAVQMQLLLTLQKLIT